MSLLNDQPVRRKLVIIVILVTSLALLSSGVAFGVYQHYVARENMVRDLGITAAIIGDNSSAALEFNEANSAQEILRSLEAQPNVIAACIYDKSGAVFASYQRSRQNPMALPKLEEPGHRFESGRLVIFKPILTQKEVAGSIFIASDLTELRDEMVGYCLTGIIVFGAALLLIWLLASRMQRHIWHPIQQLASAASAVARDKSYGLRVTRENNDEIGCLVDQFNGMLGEIERRDAALKEARDELEARVLQRTRELELQVLERNRAEEALKESKALYSSLVEHIPIGVYRKDFLGRYTFVNKAYCEAVGLAEDKLLGKTDFDTPDAANAEKYRRDDEKVMLSCRKLTVEEQRMSPSGPRDIHVVKVPVIGSDGTVKGTQGCFFDVTEQHKMREELAYERDLLRTLLDNSPDHIYFKDAQSRFIKCSKIFAQSLGLKSVEEIVGKTDADIFQGSHAAEALADEQEIIRTGIPLVGKVEHEIWTSGRESWVITTKVPYRDSEGNIIGTFGISKDITEIKRAEREVSQLHSRLLDASHKAGMAEVATGVLHNVGNVLNSINVSTTLIGEQIRQSRVGNLGKAAAMLQENLENLPEFLREDPRGKQLPGYLVKLASHLDSERTGLLREVALLVGHVEHVKEIVSMQQAYAKVSGVRESLQPGDLIEDALRINGASLVRHYVKVVRDFKPSRSIVIDRHKVLQILINLISNAKHALDAADVAEKVIRISIEEDPGTAAVQIIVRDNGVGISSENLDRIFEHGFTTRKNGHGFGLHSSALAAKELGGSLMSQSEGPGRGATFILRLPVEAPESKDSQQA